MEYIIITGDRLEVEKQIYAKIRSGWKLQGGVSVSCAVGQYTLYAQAIKI